MQISLHVEEGLSSLNMVSSIIPPPKSSICIFAVWFVATVANRLHQAVSDSDWAGSVKRLCLPEPDEPNNRFQSKLAFW